MRAGIALFSVLPVLCSGTVSADEPTAGMMGKLPDQVQERKSAGPVEATPASPAKPLSIIASGSTAIQPTIRKLICVRGRSRESQAPDLKTNREMR